MILHFGGKCIHPLWGNPNPKVGTPIVTYAGCTEDRLQFCYTNEGDLKHLTSGLCIEVINLLCWLYHFLFHFGCSRISHVV